MALGAFPSGERPFQARPTEGANLHRRGGLPKDDALAVSWYRKAADQGNASAQSNLGTRYEYGHGVPRSDAQAAVWYRKAADQGNAYAQTSLGTMYSFGRGVPVDYAQAMAWYRKAAAQGDDRAKLLLDVMRTWLASQGNGTAGSARTNCPARCTNQCTEYTSGSAFPRLNGSCYNICGGFCETQNNLNR